MTNQSNTILSRRAFGQVLGAGILISMTDSTVHAQRRGRRQSQPQKVAARLHIGQNGIITVMTGKVEVGQNSRAQITQAAAEELRVSPHSIRLIMADTDRVPDDGITAGSRTTSSTIPAVRKGAAAAREILLRMACQEWQIDQKDVAVKDGVITHQATTRTMTYAELAQRDDLDASFEQSVPNDVELRAVETWEVMGTSLPRPNLGDLVTGTHHFPSDIQRPEMHYGKVLRAPSYGAELTDINLAAVESMEDVVVVRDGDFVGCVAPTSYQAGQAVKALAATATWKTIPLPSSEELFAHLRENAQSRKPALHDQQADQTLQATYEVAYIQHAPMEPRAAVAEWDKVKLTVWTGSQAPTRVHGQLAEAFGLPREQVRVIIPDTGGGFGGKHSGEVAVEAARLARKAGRPVSLRWTREEEFTWAYFRPAALIDIRADLSKDGHITAWDFATINPGGSAAESPYELSNAQVQSLNSRPLLRQGSYRCLGATANNFARESFMDELARAAGIDPLAFRLTHLDNPRLRAVLEAAADKFNWNRRKKQSTPGHGIGLACGTEKGSVVATCAEVSVEKGRIHVHHICQAFECGAIQNPANLKRQVTGCIIMGLGGALTEAIRFEEAKILNPRFSSYRVPRFKDVPEIDIHLLDRPDLSSVGGSETPIIAIAPAIANALYHATGIRSRSMPISGESSQPA
jgi:isoquinoline 1-oxidoreductase